MPQGEKFWNPYRLVPARKEVSRSAPVTHERYAGHSGIISCTLENLTPILIKKNNNTPDFQKRNNRPVIPGSSLKGMLRSLAEIVGGGCFTISDKKTRPDNEFSACSRVSSLCITCRMFGAMEKSSGARVHTGKIGIGDAIVREENPVQCEEIQVYLGSQGIRHEPFYRTPETGKMDKKSRKLYFHQPQRREKAPVCNSKDSWSIRPLTAGHHFDFEIQFTNLTDDELSLLLYVINLEEQVNVEIGTGDDKVELKGPMRHKIGYGKPLGLGSCRIDIDRLTYLASPKQRLSTLDAAPDRRFEGDELQNEILKRTKDYVNNNDTLTMQYLRKMMVWDESDTREFGYPGYRWFKDDSNKGLPLKKL